MHKPSRLRSKQPFRKAIQRDLRTLRLESLESRSMMDGDMGDEIASLFLASSLDSYTDEFIPAEVSVGMESGAILDDLHGSVEALQSSIVGGPSPTLLGSIDGMRVVAFGKEVLILDPTSLVDSTVHDDSVDHGLVATIHVEGFIVESFLDGDRLTIVSNSNEGKGSLQVLDLSKPNEPTSISSLKLDYYVSHAFESHGQFFVARINTPEFETAVYPSIDRSSWTIEVIDPQNSEGVDRPSYSGPGYLGQWIEADNDVFIVSQQQRANRLLDDSENQVWQYVGDTHVSRLQFEGDSIQFEQQVLPPLANFVPMMVEVDNSGMLTMVAFDTSSDRLSNSKLFRLVSSEGQFAWSSLVDIGSGSEDGWVVHQDFDGPVGLVGTWDTLTLLKTPDSSGVVEQGKIEDVGGVVRWLRLDETHIASVSQFFAEFPLLYVDDGLQVVADTLPDRSIKIQVYDVSTVSAPVLLNSRELELEAGFGSITDSDIQYDATTRQIVVVDRTQSTPLLEVSESTLYAFQIDSSFQVENPKTLSIAGNVRSTWLANPSLLLLTSNELFNVSLGGSISILGQAHFQEQSWDVGDFFPIPFESPFPIDSNVHATTNVEIPHDKLLQLISDFGVDGFLEDRTNIQIVRANAPSGVTSKFTLAFDGEEWDCDLIEGESVVLRSSTNMFHNMTAPSDVNDDGDITPLDALIVVNLLNDRGSYKLPNRLTNGSPSMNLDPSGDFEFSPLDLLYVFEELNARASAKASVASIAAARLAYPIDIEDSATIDDETAVDEKNAFGSKAEATFSDQHAIWKGDLEEALIWVDPSDWKADDTDLAINELFTDNLQSLL